MPWRFFTRNFKPHHTAGDQLAWFGAGWAKQNCKLLLYQSCLFSLLATGLADISMIIIAQNFPMQIAIRDLAVHDREQLTVADRFADISIVMTLNLVSKPCKQTLESLITSVARIQPAFDREDIIAKMPPRYDGEAKPTENGPNLIRFRFKESPYFLG